MTSDDWKTIFTAARPMLVAVVTAIGSAGAILVGGGSYQVAAGAAFASFSAVYLEILRRRSDEAARTAVETKGLMNGRLDQLLATKDQEKVEAVAKAYAEGHATGVAKVSAAIAQSPKVSLDGQGVAQAIAAAVKPEVKP